MPEEDASGRALKCDFEAAAKIKDPLLAKAARKLVDGVNKAMAKDMAAWRKANAWVEDSAVFHAISTQVGQHGTMEYAVLAAPAAVRTLLPACLRWLHDAMRVRAVFAGAGVHWKGLVGLGAWAAGPEARDDDGREVSPTLGRHRLVLDCWCRSDGTLVGRTGCIACTKALARIPLQGEVPGAD